MSHMQVAGVVLLVPVGLLVGTLAPVSASATTPVCRRYDVVGEICRSPAEAAGYAVGDVDGDGVADLIVSGWLTPEETWEDPDFRWNASVRRVSLGAGGPVDEGDIYGWAEGPVYVLDFDMDGALDVVLGREAMLLLGDGRGGFRMTEALAPGAESWSLVDVDGNGTQDVVYPYDGGLGTRVAFNDGRGGLGRVASVPVSSGVAAVAIDFDDDGRRDLLLRTAEGWTVVVPGVGPDFGEPILLRSGLPWPLAVADLDGDGREDLATATGILYVRDGGVLEPAAVELPGWSKRVGLLDVDGDGHDDIVRASETALTVQLGGPSGAAGEADVVFADVEVHAWTKDVDGGLVGVGADGDLLRHGDDGLESQPIAEEICVEDRVCTEWSEPDLDDFYGRSGGCATLPVLGSATGAFSVPLLLLVARRRRGGRSR